MKANEEVLQQWWLADLVLYVAVHFSTEAFVFLELSNIFLTRKFVVRNLNLCFKWAEKKCRTEPIGLAIAMSVTWKPSLVGVLFYYLFFCIHVNYPGRN